MKNIYLLLPALLFVSSSAHAADTRNEKNVNELEKIIFGKASDKESLTQQGKTDKNTACSIIITATRFGVSISVKEKDGSREFRAAKSSKVSRDYSPEVDEGTYRAEQVEVTEDERGYMIVSQKLVLTHREEPGQKGNVASVEVTTNFSKSQDPDKAEFDESKAETSVCSSK